MVRSARWGRWVPWDRWALLGQWVLRGEDNREDRGVDRDTEKDAAAGDDICRVFCRNPALYRHPGAAPSQKHNIVS